MRVCRTDHAKRQLAAIPDCSAQDSPRYAVRVADRLTRVSQQIARFPKSGRLVAELMQSEIREVIEPPYCIVYLPSSERIDVLTVFRGA